MLEEHSLLRLIGCHWTHWSSLWLADWRHNVPSLLWLPCLFRKDKWLRHLIQLLKFVYFKNKQQQQQKKNVFKGRRQNSPLKATEGPWSWWVMVINCHQLFAAQLWWLTTISISDVTDFSVTTCCQLQRQVGDHIFGILTFPLTLCHTWDLNLQYSIHGESGHTSWWTTEWPTDPLC